MQILVARSSEPIAAELEQQHLAWMPPPVRTAILRYRRWQDRQATLFGKLLLLHHLRTEYPHCGPHPLQALDRSPAGKPFLPGGPSFNISHSGKLVVLAVTRQGNVGIDIEQKRAVVIEEFSNFLPELASLNGRSDAEAINLFFDCWTQKEAVLKGCGGGLSVPLAEVVLAPDGAWALGTHWQLRKPFIDAEYCCHLATDQPTPEMTVRFVDLRRSVA